MITSHRNPLIKQVRALAQTRARRESGLFLVEGIFHVGAALEAGWQPHVLLVAPELLTSSYGRRLVSEAETAGQPVQQVSADVFRSLAGKENPQGLLGVFRQRSWRPDAPRRVVALVSPQDPGNVGTILRTLDAVGGDALFLLEGGVDLYHPTLVRASMGALFYVPVWQADRSAFWDWARRSQAFVVGTSAHAQQDWKSVQLPEDRPVALLMGSEQKGLMAEDLAACALQVSLPMRGHTTSLNLAVATGILLYRFWG